MNGPINKGVSSALPRVFSHRSAILKIVEEKALGTRLGTAPESFYTNEFLGTVPRLPVPRLSPGGSLGTPKILGNGAALHLGPIRLHNPNWECRALRRIYTTFILGTALQNFGTRAFRFGHGPLDLHGKI